MYSTFGTERSPFLAGAGDEERKHIDWGISHVGQHRQHSAEAVLARRKPRRLMHVTLHTNWLQLHRKLQPRLRPSPHFNNNYHWNRCQYGREVPLALHSAVLTPNAGTPCIRNSTPTLYNYNFTDYPRHECGQRQCSCIETAYGLDGSGIEFRWGQDFPHPASCAMDTRLFSGGKTAGAWPWHPRQQVPRQKKSRAIPLLPVWAFMTCSKVNFTFTFFHATNLQTS